MRVLHLVKTTEGATWALRQMRELVVLNIDVHVVLPSYSGKASMYKKTGVKVHTLDTDLSFKSGWNLLFRLIAFRNLLKEIKPDLVHSHFVSTTLFMRLAMRGICIPRIFQVPGPLHLEHFFFRNLELMVSDRNDYWIASCEWTKKKYQSLLVNKNRTFLSYYGTDVDTFVSESREYLFIELGIQENAKIIGMVAYMYPPKYYLGQKRGLKGHEDLIDAVSIVLEQHHNIKLVFVGGAWAGATRYEKRVIEYGKKKLGDNVFFLGTRTGVSKLYSGFDMAVHPSHSENVGGAVESLLMNIPTITSNVGGFPDLIKHGKTGLLAKAGNPSNLAKKILCYLENPELAQQNSKKGSEYARYLFDVKRTAKEVKKIYQKIFMVKNGHFIK
jgi:glycosyltransferase involved in cell wall biosynthesis